jgi:hypothetical protein
MLKIFKDFLLQKGQFVMLCANIYFQMVEHKIIAQKKIKSWFTQKGYLSSLISEIAKNVIRKIGFFVVRANFFLFISFYNKQKWITFYQTNR